MKAKCLVIFGCILLLSGNTFREANAETFGRLLGKALVGSPKRTQQEIDDKIIEGFETASTQLNSQAPVMIDKETRFDKATVGPGASATYHHTFINYPSRDLDSNLIQTKLRPVVTNNVCANNKMKPSLQYGGIYIYSYSGNDGVEVGSFQISREDCGFPLITPE